MKQLHGIAIAEYVRPGLSFVQLQFRLSPIMVFAIGIEDALDVAIDRPRDAKRNCYLARNVAIL
jgi:hypothetical protein